MECYEPAYSVDVVYICLSPFHIVVCIALSSVKGSLAALLCSCSVYSVSRLQDKEALTSSPLNIYMYIYIYVCI